MIESTDYLLEKHFNKTLADHNVEILDPATGTGTFVAELIEHIPAQYLPYKFEQEIHANEVAILPYYIANLNIEYTYQQKIGKYQEFKNICFVDTLDNTAALNYRHKQELMFGISSENAARIKKQNERKISVIIGNPPYNAKQANYNFQNSAAWEYRLGNRSALEWILDQYKEKRPQDATIAERFNTYRFADYKEPVIELLKRVCTVSVKTVEITGQMPEDV
ncbi:MAG: hypothetical protein QOE33_1262 [Acidobacteriota bacterium]|nr:hypothetical protein [Acidobacteriota bacterium]